MRSTLLATTLLIAPLLAAANEDRSQPTIVFRCPGPPIVYRDDLTREAAASEGCSPIEGTPLGASPVKSLPGPATAFAGVEGARLISQLSRQAMEQLKDPEAARLRGIGLKKTLRRDVAAICGEVNGKNSFGGYTGYTRFISATNGHVSFERGNPQFREHWLAYCR
jgi:hypothetical protein